MKLPFWIKPVRSKHNKETGVLEITYHYGKFWIALTYLRILPNAILTYLKNRFYGTIN